MILFNVLSIHSKNYFHQSIIYDTKQTHYSLMSHGIENPLLRGADYKTAAANANFGVNIRMCKSAKAKWRLILNLMSLSFWICLEADPVQPERNNNAPKIIRLVSITE